MTSPLRAALAAKRARTDTFPVAVRDPQAARAAFEKAQQDEAMLRFRDAPAADIAKAARVREKAERELRDCFYEVQLQSIPAPDYEALQSAHTTDDGLNLEALLPDLLAVSVVDGDLSAEEWKAELASGRWSAGDRLELSRKLVEINQKSLSEGIPKG